MPGRECSDEASGIRSPRTQKQETNVHPFPLYLAATDVEHNYRGGAERNRRPQYAAVDALPLNEPAPVSRRDRLIAILRRRVAPTAIA